jgi:hypothetical protein
LPEYDQFVDWWRAQVSLRAGRSTIDRALLCGAQAPCVAFAFAAGYQAALRALIPSLDLTTLVALCVSERGGGHPRAIETRLTRRANRGWLLSGEKNFITLGVEAQKWIIAASRGDTSEGLNDIAMVMVDADTPGTVLTPLPSLPIIPEISHASLRLEAVSIPEEALLEGDGYLTYIKPFRTLEDLHVLASLVGYCLGEGCRQQWLPEMIDRLLALATTLRALSGLDPYTPAAHLALAGTLSLANATFAEVTAQFEASDNSASLDRWRRDLGLLRLAERARQKRRATAWGNLTDTSAS